MLGALLGCDGGGEEPGGPKAVAGSGGSGGSSVLPGGGSSGSGGGGALPEGVALTPIDGWVDIDSNTIGVQGAMFSYGDDVSKMGMESDFTGSNACIKGTAAKVEMPCEFMPPATDCYGQFWGAAIGLNLNQPIDEATGMGVETPLPYDASALKGFAFEISGATVPTSLRFKIEDATGEFCNLGTMKVGVGPNTFLFSDLTTECWKPTATSRKGDTAKAGLLKIAWQVVTNTSGTIPFDYCVSNVRALPQ